MASETGRGRLAVRSVEKRYGSVRALSAIDLDVASGEFLALLGPSGCGKTTLLRCIAGLVPVAAGDILIDGQSILHVPPWKRDVSVVFQSYALFPHMTVAENVAFGLKMRGLDSETARRRIADALDLVHMTGFEGRRPSELSGGQQQRVALARAIVVQPTLLLLDEPLAALDARLRSSVRLEIRSLQKQLGITTVLVTHDQEEAMTMADRIAVMNAGRIEQIGAPEALYDRPATPFVAEFIGDMNALSGHVLATGDGSAFRVDGAPGISIRLPPDAAGSPPQEGPATLFVRPERVRVCTPADAGPGDISGRVQEVILIGDRRLLVVDLSGACLKAVILNAGADREGFRPGDDVRVSWAAEDTTVFRASL